jgi:hypothetical protein
MPSKEGFSSVNSTVIASCGCLCRALRRIEDDTSSANFFVRSPCRSDQRTTSAGKHCADRKYLSKQPKDGPHREDFQAPECACAEAMKSPDRCDDTLEVTGGNHLLLLGKGCPQALALAKKSGFSAQPASAFWVQKYQGALREVHGGQTCSFTRGGVRAV